MKRVISLLILYFLLNSIALSQEKWEIHTHTGAIHGLIREGDYLWAAASGGVIRWNLQDSTYVLVSVRIQLPPSQASVKCLPEM